MNLNGQQPVLPDPCEIIQVPNCGVNSVKLPNGIVMLMFTLPNGRQYQFPLDNTGRKAVINALSGIQVPG